MDYRKLGRTSIMASVVGMGSEGFVGGSFEETAALVDAAMSFGINYFDLYNPDPDVRSNLGRALMGRRERVHIEGHICTAWQNGQYKRTRDRALTEAFFEDLLERLKTDYIDVGMIHYIDAIDDFHKVFEGPIIEYVERLKASGRIRAIGLSSHNPLAAKMAVDTGLVDVLLFSVNPAYDMQPATEDIEKLYADESYERPLHGFDDDRMALYRACENRGVGITVMKAFGGGDLLDAKLSPFGVALTGAQCIHYALTRPAVASVLCGLRTPGEVAQAAQYPTLSDEEKDYAPALVNVPKHTFVGKCMYCGHCAPCTVGIDVAMVNKFLDLSVAEGFVPETVREHYASLAHHAGECIGCGVCEENCPFGVRIAEKMIEAKELFGK